MITLTRSYYLNVQLGGYGIVKSRYKGYKNEITRVDGI